MNQEKNKKSYKWISVLLKYAVPFIVTIGLCWVLFTGINFSEMVEVIRTDCNFWYVGLGLVLAIAAQVFRAFRWRMQLKALGINPPVSALIYSILGTYSVNLVFPRLGEIWRAGYIANRQKSSFSVVLGSVVADRLADTISVALLLVTTLLLASRDISSYFMSNPQVYESFKRFADSPWIYVVVALLVALCIWIIKGRTKNKIVLKIRKLAKDMWDGFAIIRSMKGKGRWLLYTVGIWGSYFVQMLICFYAFTFTRQLIVDEGPIVALVSFTLASIAMGVPSNGGIGPWQFAVVFALSVYGLNNMTEANAFANVVLGCNTLLLIVQGLFTFAAIAFDRKRLRLNSAKDGEEEDDKDEGDSDTAPEGEAVSDNIVITPAKADAVTVNVPVQPIQKNEVNV